MKTYITLMILAAGCAVSHAAGFTNSPDANAFVRSNAPTLNYGGAGALSVSGPTAVNGSNFANGAFDTFIRFNAGAMVSNFNTLFGSNNWVVNGAQLQVTEVAAPMQTNFNRGKGMFQVRWIANDNWTQGTGTPMSPSTNDINYNDESTLLNSNVDVNLGAFTNAGANATEVFPLALPASFVQDIQAGGEVGLFLTAISPGIGFTFNSQGFGTPSARPFLIISALPVPVITGIDISGADALLSVANAAPGASYQVLGGTNVTQPLNQWLPVAPAVVATNSNLSITVTNAMVSAPAQQFFILQAQ